MNYKINPLADLTFKSGVGNLSDKLTIQHLLDAVEKYNRTIYSIQENVPVDIFSILGMRNLSAFVGEVFARSLAEVSDGLLVSNPHQDGYPDLLLLDEYGKQLFEEINLNKENQNKSPFSPFLNGGIEIKATCGSVPTPEQCQKKGFKKPTIGEQRIELLKNYDWKAHHQETNNLLGLLWDFIEGKPTIAAAFFGNTLTPLDWGDIVQPKEGGGRTTSVSIMPRHGVYKMYQNWLLVLDDERYINFINKYNKDNLI